MSYRELPSPPSSQYPIVVPLPVVPVTTNPLASNPKFIKGVPLPTSVIFNFGVYTVLFEVPLI